jgi:hypothetical protein
VANPLTDEYSRPAVSGAFSWIVVIIHENGLRFHQMNHDWFTLRRLMSRLLAGLELIEEKGNWQVDVSIYGYEIPCTTALPEPKLAAEGESAFPPGGLPSTG